MKLCKLAVGALLVVMALEIPVEAALSARSVGPARSAGLNAPGQAQMQLVRRRRRKKKVPVKKASLARALTANAAS